MYHHHPALLLHQALIMDRLLIFLTAFTTLISSSLSQNLSLNRQLSFRQADLLEIITTRCLAVTGGGSIDECGFWHSII